MVFRILFFSVLLGALSNSSFADLIAGQDFDSETSWNATADPAFGSFSSSGDEWDIVDANTTITGLALTGNFVGALDLANGDNSDGEVSLTFDELDVRLFTGVAISFEYDIDGYDAAAGDSAGYFVTVDGVDQPEVDLLASGTPDGNGNNISVSGTESIVLGTASTIGFTLLLDNNGSDGAVFDNFQLTGTAVPEPGSVGLLGLVGLCSCLRRRRV